MNPAATRQICTFYLDNRLYGIDVLKIQEVIQKHEITEVPLAPDVICGLMNLRGSIVSSLDLRKRLGLPPPPDEAESVNVVTQSGAGLVSLRVDRIGDVVETVDACYEPPPGTLNATMRRLIEGVYKLDQELLLILDVDEVLNL